MEKVSIADLNHGKDEWYIRLVAKKTVMKVIKEIVEELDKKSSCLWEEDSFSLPFSDYNKWKDETINFSTKDIKGMFICGNKYIHWLIYEIKDKKKIKDIIKKYCVWSKTHKRAIIS
jgi:hypothetical protein